MSKRSAFITLVTGERLYAFDPKPDQISAEAIAVGLSNECRWGSQLYQFYSVAQHSVLVSDAAVLRAPLYGITDEQTKRAIGLAGLLHDAAEGLGFRDLPTPVKQHLPFYTAGEHHLLAVVLDKYLNAHFPPEVVSLVFSSQEQALRTQHGTIEDELYRVPWLHPAIKDADEIVLATEHRDLRSNASKRHGWQPAHAANLATIAPWPAGVAFAQWMKRFKEFTR